MINKMRKKQLISNKMIVILLLLSILWSLAFSMIGLDEISIAINIFGFLCLILLMTRY